MSEVPLYSPRRDETPSCLLLAFFDFRTFRISMSPFNLAIAGHFALSYRCPSPASKRTPLGSYRGLMPRVLGGSWGGGRFLMGEVPL